MTKYDDPQYEHELDKIARNADEVERGAVEMGTVPLAEGVRDEQIAGTLEEEFRVVDPERESVWADRDTATELAQSDTAVELRRRSEILGASYPFQLGTNSLTYRKSQTLAYELCLAIALAKSVTRRPYNRMPQAFERLAGKVVCRHLGADADWYRTGWPPAGDRPKYYRRVIQVMHEKTREFDWAPAPGLERDPGPKKIKDGGVDVVAWKLFRDDRIGNVFLLGQCACGQDWDEKCLDLQPSAIRSKWLRNLSVAEQLRFFAVPFHIPHAARWRKASCEGGIVFDRIRIAMVAEQPGNREWLLEDRRDDYDELIRIVIPGF